MNKKLQDMIEQFQSYVYRRLEKNGSAFGLSFDELEKTINNAAKKVIEEAYQLGLDEANASWQSTISEALNSGPGYYKP